MNARSLNNFYLWGIRILVFIIPFLSLWISSSMYFPYITGRNFSFRILVEIALVLWIGLIILNKNYRPKLSKIFLAILIFAAIVGLADLFGINPYHSFWSRLERMEGYLMVLHLVTYFTILTSVFRNKKDWKVFFNLIVTAGVLVGGYGVLQVLGLKEAIQGGGVRIDGTIGNPTYLAAYLSLVIAIALLLLFGSDKKWQKYLYGAAAGFSLFVMFFTASRGAMVAWLISVPLFLILYLILFKDINDKEKIFKKLAVIFLILMVLVPSIIWLIKDTEAIQGNETLARLTSISLTERTTRARFIIWSMAWQAFLERPILGWGQENFLQAFSKYYDPRLYDQEPWFDRPHNIFFEWLLNAGILGLISYLSLFVFLYWGIIYILKKQSIGKKEGLILLVVPVTYFVQNFFVFDNFNTYILFFAILAYVNALAVNPDSENDLSEPDQSKINLSLGLSAIAFVLMLAVIYFIGVRPIQQARGIIRGLQATTDQVDPVGKSLEEFQKAIALKTFADGESLEQLSRAATLLLGQGNIPNSAKIPFFQYTIQELERHLERFPDNIRIHLMAAGLYQGAQALNPDFVNLAREHMETSLAMSPAKQQIMFILADNYLSTGDSDKALQLMRKAVELEPSNREASVNLAILGIIFTDTEIVMEALFNLDQAWAAVDDKRNPPGPLWNYITDLNRIAFVFIQAGQQDNASVIYNQILSLRDQYFELGALLPTGGLNEQESYNQLVGNLEAALGL